MSTVEYVEEFNVDGWIIRKETRTSGFINAYIDRHMPCNSQMYHKGRKPNYRICCKKCGMCIPHHTYECLIASFQAIRDSLPFI